MISLIIVQILFQNYTGIISESRYDHFIVVSLFGHIVQFIHMKQLAS